MATLSVFIVCAFGNFLVDLFIAALATNNVEIVNL